MMHPRPHVEAERRQREPARPLLEDVFVARPMALREDGAAAQDRAEVEHVVLDPVRGRSAVSSMSRLLMPRESSWFSQAPNTRAPRSSRRCSCGTMSFGSSGRVP